MSGKYSTFVLFPRRAELTTGGKSLSHFIFYFLISHVASHLKLTALLCLSQKGLPYTKENCLYFVKVTHGFELFLVISTAVQSQHQRNMVSSLQTEKNCIRKLG